MIIAFGVDGDGYKFRFGVKSDKSQLLVMPPYTDARWPSIPDIKRSYPCMSAAAFGQWCWYERTPDGL